MKKGSYRFLITHITEILITVDDLAQFNAAFQKWAQKDAAFAPKNLRDPAHYMKALAIRVTRNESPGTAGFRFKTEFQDVEIEPIRTCRHCGCTEESPCHLGEDDTCTWIDYEVCSNPACGQKMEEENETLTSPTEG